MNSLNNIKVGDPVTVSNGEPMPPKHHTKKLAGWGLFNFDGFVSSIDSDRVCVSRQPNGRVAIAQNPKHVTLRSL